MSENFFSRWSRRKQDIAGRQPESAPTSAPDRVQAPAALPSASPVPAATEAPMAVPEPALPTLEDAEQLTSASDFQPFMQRGVVAEVRNAAMKKLFADPHFNVMDGLDIYIDDYSQPDPLPAGMLRKMTSAQFLRLVPEDPQESHGQDPDAAEPPQHEAQVVAQSPDSSAPAEPPQYDHPDLQLQPDPAPADPSPGPRAR
ncbi:MAG: DUF3306 domain-containing protein [Limnohabitans sp.]